METGFIKYGKNQVVKVSSIQTIEHISTTNVNHPINISFIVEGIGRYYVEPEYEQEWRDRFDLNDKE